MACALCGTANPPGNRYCGHCGGPLPPSPGDASVVEHAAPGPFLPHPPTQAGPTPFEVRAPSAPRVRGERNERLFSPTVVTIIVALVIILAMAAAGVLAGQSVGS